VGDVAPTSGTASREEKTMASHAAPVRERPLPGVNTAPRTFQDALKQGWSVVSEKSHQSISQKRREGKLTMQKKGCAGLLQLDYIGTTKGYRFSVPKFVYVGSIQ
jgi:hypothetical protein